jgi:hypothetical protein
LLLLVRPGAKGKMSRQREKTRVQAVQDFYAAVRDSRITDLLGLVHPDVECAPLGRNLMSKYTGRRGMIALIEDLHDWNGNYQHEIDGIREDGPNVTVDARIFPEPGYGESPFSVTTVFTFRDSLIDVILSMPTRVRQPDGAAGRSPADRPADH